MGLKDRFRELVLNNEARDFDDFYRMSNKELALELERFRKTYSNLQLVLIDRYRRLLIVVAQRFQDDYGLTPNERAIDRG